MLFVFLAFLSCMSLSTPSTFNFQLSTHEDIHNPLSTHNSYTMGCPPVRGDNPRALASELSYLRTGGQTWYIYFMPPTSV